ncbi:serine threonine protein phosphatase, partial [Cystoisospora suis]
MTSMSPSSPLPERPTEEGQSSKDSSLNEAQKKKTQDISSSQASSSSQSEQPMSTSDTSEKSGKRQQDDSMDVDPVDQAIADAVSASEEEEEKKEQACDKIKRAEKENAEEEASTEECYKEMQQQAESLKSEGNSFFKEGLFHQAVEKYTLAIELLSDHTMTKTSQQILQSLLSNRAFCHIKLENYGSGIVDAERALQFNPLFSKAYYRRGCAYLCLSKYKKAQK